MLVIKVELWPQGDESRKSEISRMNLWNVHSYVDTKGGRVSDYEFTIVEPSAWGDDQTFHHGTLERMNRNKSVWSLIRSALKTITFNTDDVVSRSEEPTKQKR
jgi:hypothetical protein